MHTLDSSQVASVVAVAGLVAGFVRVFMITGRLTFQVETLWDFHVRRGTVEAVRAGWGTVNSPFHISVSGFEAALPFLTKFLPFYAQLMKKNPNMPERDMMLLFEHEFGDFIMEKVCIPQGVSQGACLVAILAACKVGLNEVAPPLVAKEG